MVHIIHSFPAKEGETISSQISRLDERLQPFRANLIEHGVTDADGYILIEKVELDRAFNNGQFWIKASFEPPQPQSQEHPPPDS